MIICEKLYLYRTLKGTRTTCSQSDTNREAGGERAMGVEPMVANRDTAQRYE